MEVLDREKRSQYIVPVVVSDLSVPPRSATINLRIYVDDQDDNAPESSPREVNIELNSRIPATVALHVVPVDLDQVGWYSCRLLNTTQTYSVMLNHFINMANGTIKGAT